MPVRDLYRETGFGKNILNAQVHYLLIRLWRDNYLKTEFPQKIGPERQMIMKKENVRNSYFYLFSVSLFLRFLRVLCAAPVVISAPSRASPACIQKGQAVTGSGTA